MAVGHPAPHCQPGTILGGNMAELIIACAIMGLSGMIIGFALSSMLDKMGGK